MAAVARDFTQFPQEVYNGSNAQYKGRPVYVVPTPTGGRQYVDVQTRQPIPETDWIDTVFNSKWTPLIMGGAFFGPYLAATALGGAAGATPAAGSTVGPGVSFGGAGSTVAPGMSGVSFGGVTSTGAIPGVSFGGAASGAGSGMFGAFGDWIMKGDNLWNAIGLGTRAVGGALDANAQQNALEAEQRFQQEQLRQRQLEFERQMALQERQQQVAESQIDPYKSQRSNANMALSQAIMPNLQNFNISAPSNIGSDPSSWVPQMSGGLTDLFPSDNVRVGTENLPWREAMRNRLQTSPDLPAPLPPFNPGGGAAPTAPGRTLPVEPGGAVAPTTGRTAPQPAAIIDQIARTLPFTGDRKVAPESPVGTPTGAPVNDALQRSRARNAAMLAAFRRV